MTVKFYRNTGLGIRESTPAEMLSGVISKGGTATYEFKIVSPNPTPVDVVKNMEPHYDMQFLAESNDKFYIIDFHEFPKFKEHADKFTNTHMFISISKEDIQAVLGNTTLTETRKIMDAMDYKPHTMVLIDNETNKPVDSFGFLNTDALTSIIEADLTGRRVQFFQNHLPFDKEPHRPSVARLDLLKILDFEYGKISYIDENDNLNELFVEKKFLSESDIDRIFSVAKDGRIHSMKYSNSIPLNIYLDVSIQNKIKEEVEQFGNMFAYLYEDSTKEVSSISTDPLK